MNIQRREWPLLAKNGQVPNPDGPDF